MTSWEVLLPSFLLIPEPGCRYCILGDGCNMEGISNEAASLAGHWGLGKLIALYDDNKISIDGDTDISFTEDVAARFEALGWHVQTVQDGNTDIEGLRSAISSAQSVTDKPSLIKVLSSAAHCPSCRLRSEITD